MEGVHVDPVLTVRANRSTFIDALQALTSLASSGETFAVFRQQCQAAAEELAEAVREAEERAEHSEGR